jgi:hypothetical protein
MGGAGDPTQAAVANEDAPTEPHQEVPGELHGGSENRHRAATMLGYDVALDGLTTPERR